MAYGSDAIGGAVNVISDIPEAGTPGLHGRVLYRYSSAESSDTVRLDGTYRGDSLRVHGARASRTTAMSRPAAPPACSRRPGTRTTPPTCGSSTTSAPIHRCCSVYQLVDQDDAWRTHRTIYGISWRGTQVGTDRELRFDQRRQLGYVQVQHDGVGAMADSLRASVSYHEQSEDTYRLRSNLRSDQLGFDVRTTGLWLQFDKLWGRTQFVYGADWYSDDVSSFNVEYNADGSTRRVHVQGPVADDARYDLGGVFAQAIVRATPRFTATLGARYTFASVDAGQVEDPVTFAASSLEDDWDNFSGSARLAFAPVESGPWLVYAAVAQAFRAPNLSDLTRLDVARSGELETPSPGVEPETYVSYEFGVKYAGDRVVRPGGVLQHPGRGRDHPRADGTGRQRPDRSDQGQRRRNLGRWHRGGGQLRGARPPVAVRVRHVPRRRGRRVPVRRRRRSGARADRPADAAELASRSALDRRARGFGSRPWSSMRTSRTSSRPATSSTRSASRRAARLRTRPSACVRSGRSVPGSRCRSRSRT